MILYAKMTMPNSQLTLKPLSDLNVKDIVVLLGLNVIFSHHYYIESL